MAAYTSPPTAPPAEPGWEEDPNSPFSTGSATSHSITLADDYDVVLLVLKKSGSSFNLRVNGDSGANYDFHVQDGTKTTGGNEVPLGTGDGPLWILMRGRGNWGASIQEMRATNAATDAENLSVSLPLDTIELVNTNGFGFSLENTRVYGVDL